MFAPKQRNEQSDIGVKRKALEQQEEPAAKRIPLAPPTKVPVKISPAEQMVIDFLAEPLCVVDLSSQKPNTMHDLVPRPIERRVSLEEVLTDSTDEAVDEDRVEEVTYDESVARVIDDDALAQRALSVGDLVPAMNQEADPRLMNDLPNPKLSFALPNSELKKLVNFSKSETAEPARMPENEVFRYAVAQLGISDCVTWNGDGTVQLNLNKFVRVRRIQDQLSCTGHARIPGPMLQVQIESDLDSCEFWCKAVDDFDHSRNDYLWQTTVLDLALDSDVRSASCDICWAAFWKSGSSIRVMKPAGENVKLSELTIPWEDSDRILHRRYAARSEMFLCCSSCFETRWSVCGGCSLNKSLPDCYEHCHPKV